MKVFALRSLRAIVLFGCLFGMLSCAREQQLVDVSVEPTTVTFGDSTIPVSADRGLAVQLRALGHYIHPPVTKDITNQVMWSSDNIQMVTVNSTGLLVATGDVCGTNAIISATVQTNSSAGNRSSSGAIVTGNMTANVVCFTGTSGGSGPILTVTFLGSGSGTVTMSPSGFICASNCSVSFASGTTVTLKAATSGTFSGWGTGSCDTVSGMTCTINNLIADRNVTVTFN